MHADSTIRAVIVLALLTGCLSQSDPSGGAPPSDSETKGATITEPLLAWSFEPASADCNGWMVKGAVAIRAIPARTGAYSCKLCADGTSEAITLTRDLGPVTAGRYELSAWVRKRAQNPAPPSALATFEASHASATTPLVSVREAWDSITTTLDLAEDSDRLRVSIGSPLAAENECLFVDDVRVEKLP